MTPSIPGKRARRELLLLGLCGAAFLAAWFVVSGMEPRPAMWSDVSLMAIGLVSGGLMLSLARRRGAWEGILFYAVAMLVLALAKLVDAVGHLWNPSLATNRSTDLAFLIIGALFLIPAHIQFREHFEKEDQQEITADVALIATALVGVVYLLLRPYEPGQELAALIWSAIFAATAAAAITAFIALALWVPTPSHLGQLAAVGIFAGATLTVGSLWVRGEDAWGNPALEVPLGLGALLLAAIMVVGSRTDAGAARKAHGGWGRPVLTAVSVLAGSVSLAIIASMQARGVATLPEGTVLIVLTATAVAARILVNQVRSRRANEAARRALGDKDAALDEAAEAMVRLRDAMDAVAQSEERLRLLFDTAVDGIVEIDGRGVVSRANESFCRMVGLARGSLVARDWQAAVAAVKTTGESLAELPETGQATLVVGSHEIYLEATTSAIPGSPPGRLLVVRDVTDAKVADQTIRSLFNYLQDRDEDRSRLLKRTNSAIEAERNRIARDLHDGPVQGVSAASLSLEAVLLMLQGEDTEGAVDTLVAIRAQLAEEADGLRRMMGDLRPPILEERGLVPALQETLSQFGKQEQLRTIFRNRSLAEVPADLEILAYRFVQEGLTNVRKHSKATELALTVDAVAGQLRVEVEDNGVGFDSAKARDFLRAGKVGLASMRERIELANGTFVVRSSPGGGTTIVATLPIDMEPAVGAGTI